MESYREKLDLLAKEAFNNARAALEVLDEHRCPIEERYKYLMVDTCDESGFIYTLEAGQVSLLKGKILILAKGMDESCISDEQPDEYWLEGSTWYAEWEGLLDILDMVIAKAVKEKGFTPGKQETPVYAIYNREGSRMYQYGTRKDLEEMSYILERAQELYPKAGLHIRRIKSTN